MYASLLAVPVFAAAMVAAITTEGCNPYKTVIPSVPCPEPTGTTGYPDCGGVTITSSLLCPCPSQETLFETGYCPPTVCPTTCLTSTTYLAPTGCSTTYVTPPPTACSVPHTYKA